MTKHIEVDCHLIHDKIQPESIPTAHAPTCSQLAGIFTKSLPSHVLSSHFSKMGIVNLYSAFNHGRGVLEHDIHASDVASATHATEGSSRGPSHKSTLKNEKVDNFVFFMNQF